MKVCIIGLGEIGREVLRIVSSKFDSIGVDKDKKARNIIKKQIVYSNVPERYDIYLLSVYTCKQVISVIKKIDYSNKPLVIIESTIDLKTLLFLVNYIQKNKSHLVICPQRYNPNDKGHHIFNQPRVIAANNKYSLERGLNFYGNFMKNDNLIKTTLKYAVLSKLIENSYRFIEIVIAQELTTSLKNIDIEFKKLREIVNTKWNIEIKEAKKGVGGKCLPKDIKLFNNIIKNKLIEKCIKQNKKYINSLKSN